MSQSLNGLFNCVIVRIKMIDVEKTTLPGVLKIKRELSCDHRGFYAEIYVKKLYQEKGINIEFVEQDFSFSKKDVLRGLHGDTKTWKLISCLYGELYLVVVNYDKNSENFGKWEGFTLNPENRLQILIPPLHINGHLILSDWGLFHYNQSEYYSGAENQFSLRWNDPRFNIKWPINNPIFSKRDGGENQ